jgi:hypothetical protein
VEYVEEELVGGMASMYADVFAKFNKAPQEADEMEMEDIKMVFNHLLPHRLLLTMLDVYRRKLLMSKHLLTWFIRQRVERGSPPKKNAKNSNDYE